MRNEQPEITSPQVLLSSYQHVLDSLNANETETAKLQQQRNDFVAFEKIADAYHQQIANLSDGIYSSDKGIQLVIALKKLGLESGQHKRFSAYASNTVMAKDDITNAISAFDDIDELIQKAKQLDKNCREFDALQSAKSKRHDEVVSEHNQKLKREAKAKEQAALAAAQRKRSLIKKLVMTSIFVVVIIAFVKFQ